MDEDTKLKIGLWTVAGGFLGFLVLCAINEKKRIPIIGPLCDSFNTEVKRSKFWDKYEDAVSDKAFKKKLEKRRIR